MLELDVGLDRMLNPSRRCFVAAFLLASAVASAQSVEVQGGQVVNGLAVPIAVLLVETAPDGFVEAHVTMVVQAQSQLPVPRQGLRLMRFEPLHRGVGKAALPACKAVARDDLVKRFREELAAVNAADLPVVERRAALESEIARLTAEGVLDERFTNENDPVAKEMERRQLAVATFEQQQELKARQAGQAAGDLTGVVLAFAIGFDARAREHASAHDDERALLEPLLEPARASGRTVERALEAYQREYEAVRELHELASKALGEEAAPVTLIGELAQPCAESTALVDWLGFEAVAPAGVEVLRGRVEFDRGLPQPVLFRRVVGSQKWFAPVAWPAPASRVARCSVEAASGWLEVKGTGSRRSATERRDQVLRAVDDLEERYEDARFRSWGTDVIKTLVIP